MRPSRPRLCKRCKAPLAVQAAGRPRLFCSPSCKQAAHRKPHRKLRTTREVMGSSRSDNWPTDPAFFARLAAEHGPFGLDPCASAENAKCPRYFTTVEDGLTKEWTGRVFMNPPYGRTMPAWMRKAWEASQTTAELVVCLVPARTDTRWWHEYATRGEITFIRGRLKFGSLENPAPFPSAVVVFRNARIAPGTVTKLRLVEEDEAA
jgi:phage N-6-adenine-methyltransferase